jgi:hypothetical protein
VTGLLEILPEEVEGVVIPADVSELLVTCIDPNCGTCGGSGWVTVYKDGATEQEKCPICNI